MNRKLKQIINKFAYSEGLKHYEARRSDLFIRAKTMASAGMPLQAIISELGIPMPQEPEQTAQKG